MPPHFSDVDHLVEIAEAVQSKLDAFKADKRDLGTVSTTILYTIMYIVASVSTASVLVFIASTMPFVLQGHDKAMSQLIILDR